MNSVQEIILLFTKFPEPGKSKTRLIPAVGAEQAALIQRQMTTEVLASISHYRIEYPIDLRIYYDGGTLHLMREWLGEQNLYTTQINGDLGSRMAAAITEHIQKYAAIVIVGSDCPDIDSVILHQAFTALRSYDVVIGPAYDGGYYLIGVQANITQENLNYLFTEINWGSGEVLSQTIAKLREKNLSYRLLKRLNDIDTPEDLQHFNYNPNA